MNNAGSALVGALEETDLDQAQALLDVNFFGAVRVTHAAPPHMRSRGANPAEIAKVVLRAITARSPKLRYPAGEGAGTLAMLRRLVPARAFDRSLRKQFHFAA